MAIRINIEEGHPNLFCDSKFWGDPDMPEDMEYPMLDGYPLTFIAQVNCFDLEQFDPEGVLPHEGMLYFFAAIDGLLGYDSPVNDGPGDWPKGHALVKYTKEVNMETFKSIILMDDEDNPITAKAQPVTLHGCTDDFGGMRMLGGNDPDNVTLLHIPLDPKRSISFRISRKDLGFGNWKKAVFSLNEA